jgi:ribulose-5-phosphate 4-epimerase/fuculose-1-phosphate aldolase
VTADIITATVPSLMPALTPAAELAVLARALFREGYDDHHVGHILVRQPDDTFLSLPYELGWDEVTASDIVHIDGSGQKLDGRWSAIPANRLHLEVHRRRPGLGVSIHHHPRFATIWSALGRIPPAYDQRSVGAIDEDIILYDDYPGAVDSDDEAAAAADAIGQANFALLRNHGVFVGGDDVRQAVQRAIALEWRCRQAWYVEAVGEGRPIPAGGQAALVAALRGYGERFPMLWEWLVRRELRADAGVVE